jgi:hypothetical protein
MFASKNIEKNTIADNYDELQSEFSTDLMPLQESTVQRSARRDWL